MQSTATYIRHGNPIVFQFIVLTNPLTVVSKMFRVRMTCCANQVKAHWRNPIADSISVRFRSNDRILLLSSTSLLA